MPDWRVERLSPAGKQLVEICRAIQHGSSLLIFDEPTSSLSGEETAEVFRIVRTLRARRMGVIYITHRLEELRAIGDRVTILRDGATVHTGRWRNVSTDRIIQHMVGRETGVDLPAAAAASGRGTAARGGRLTAPRRLRDISFTLRAGEIVGLAGLIGAGRTETCRAIFGVDPVDSGEMLRGGTAGAHRLAARSGRRRASRWSPRTARKPAWPLRLPIADQHHHGEPAGNQPPGLIDRQAQAAVTAEYIARLRIRVAVPAASCRDG